MKARRAIDVKCFTDIPNVGPRVAEDFATLGLHTPADLIGKDAYVLYTDLCKRTKIRHDPCLLDVFMAVVDFMNGASAQHWWYYTAERKKQYPAM
ncbi:MAG: helix-hairpin-helix domain-containing protein [Candidatus Pacebacteria bacterium]|nr:helix-hairpin-helix domain-containing protein [Candidatus Paceibacterota bacterium]